MLVKNSARFFAQPEAPLILADINKALQRAADGAGVVNVMAYLMENRQRSFVLDNCFLIFASEVKYMAHGARALRCRGRNINLRGDPGAGLRHPLSFLQVNPSEDDHSVV